MSMIITELGFFQVQIKGGFIHAFEFGYTNFEEPQSL